MHIFYSSKHIISIMPKKDILDEIDISILKFLTEDGSKSNRSIAEELAKSPTTINNHVNDMMEQGIIEKRTIKINYEKLGYDIVALIELTIAKAKMVEVERNIATDPHVFAVYDITGEYDAVILARFKNRTELNTFVKRINSEEFIVRTNTHLVLNTVKEETDFATLIDIE